MDKKNKNCKLTDSEFLVLLKRIKEKLYTVESLVLDDSDIPGCKHTYSNVGLCQPEDFYTPIPHIRIWERQKHQKCPLDGRKEHDSTSKALGWSYGCYHKCKIFKHGMSNLRNIKRLYDIMIREYEEKREESELK